MADDVSRETPAKRITRPTPRVQEPFVLAKAGATLIVTDWLDDGLRLTIHDQIGTAAIELPPFAINQLIKRLGKRRGKDHD